MRSVLASSIPANPPGSGTPAPGPRHRPARSAARSLHVGLLCLALFGAPAQAVMDWLRGTAVMQFRESDWTLVQDTARAVLEEAADGERRDWRNETTGNRGAIKPILSFDFEGRPCRRLAFLNEAATGARGISTHTLCRQDDGEWKLVLDSEVLP